MKPLGSSHLDEHLHPQHPGYAQFVQTFPEVTHDPAYPIRGVLLSNNRFLRSSLAPIHIDSGEWRKDVERPDLNSVLRDVPVYLHESQGADERWLGGNCDSVIRVPRDIRPGQYRRLRPPIQVPQVP